MSATDTINHLLKDGVEQIVIGKTPNGGLFIKAMQAVRTGEAGNLQEITHQVEGDLPWCLEALKDFVAHANEKRRGDVLVIPRRNGQ